MAARSLGPHNKIGDVQRARGDLAAMLASYHAAHEIFERLAKADPTNALWQRDLSVSHNKLGDAQREQGELAAALSSYQASLAIRDRLAAADPEMPRGNATSLSRTKKSATCKVNRASSRRP